MLRLDKIFYDAITADADLMAICGYEAPSAAYPQGKPARIKSTCFEVGPDGEDKTPLPYIVIRDLGKQPAQTTKDDGWMPCQWRVGAGIEIGAKSPNEVDDIAMKVMKAISDHIVTLDEQNEEIPCLEEGYPQTQGIAWDWTKPCYWDIVSYQCDIDYNDDEQESNSDI